VTILAIDAAGSLSVFVAGTPVSQGSKRHVGNGVMIESSKALKPWRSDIRSALIDSAGQPRARFDGAVSCTLVFIMPRPISTPKRSTPAAVKKPDIDKLARALLDAIGSAGVWRDDSQVVELLASKRLAMIEEQPGCQISLKEFVAS
jgi:crossover junction endodeoxyribonuclease RusA